MPYVIGVIVVFLLGMGFQDYMNPMPAPEIQTRTITETVEIDVPGPTVTTNVVPESCDQLLDLADRYHVLYGDISAYAGQYADITSRIAVVGASSETVDQLPALVAELQATSNAAGAAYSEAGEISYSYDLLTIECSR